VASQVNAPVSLHELGRKAEARGRMDRGLERERPVVERLQLPGPI
jgi:hypothetical protein